jgi:hypothetical protein
MREGRFLMSYKEKLLREYIRRAILCESKLEPGAVMKGEQDFHGVGLLSYEDIHGQRRASLFGKGPFHKLAWFLNMPQSAGDLLSMRIVHVPLMAGVIGQRLGISPSDVGAAASDAAQTALDAVESEIIPDVSVSAGGWFGETFPSLATSFENVSGAIMAPDMGVGDRISSVTDELGGLESALVSDVESGLEGVVSDAESGIADLMGGEDTVPPTEVPLPEPVELPHDPDVASSEVTDDERGPLGESHHGSSLSVSHLLFEGDDRVGEEIMMALRFDIERIRDIVEEVSLSNNIVDSLKIFHRLSGLKAGDYESVEDALEAAEGEIDPKRLNDFFVDIIVPGLLKQNVDLMIHSILNSPGDSPFNRLDYFVKSSVIEQLEGIRTYLETS